MLILHNLVKTTTRGGLYGAFNDNHRLIQHDSGKESGLKEQKPEIRLEIKDEHPCEHSDACPFAGPGCTNDQTWCEASKNYPKNE